MLSGGEIIVKEGEQAKFVLVLRGIVTLTKVSRGNIMKSCGTYEQNEFFGEDCLLKRDYLSPYNANCVTTCSLLFLESEAFKRYLDSFPDSNNDIMLAIKHHKLRTSLVGSKTQFYSSNVTDGLVLMDKKRGSFDDIGKMKLKRGASEPSK